MASLQIVARSATGEWRCQQAPVAAMVGKVGLRPLVERRSGDGTTPAGSFPLGSVQAWDGQQFEFFGNRRRPRCPWAVPPRAPRGLLGSNPAHRVVPAAGQRPGMHVTRRMADVVSATSTAMPQSSVPTSTRSRAPLPASRRSPRRSSCTATRIQRTAYPDRRAAASPCPRTTSSVALRLIDPVARRRVRHRRAVVAPPSA